MISRIGIGEIRDISLDRNVLFEGFMYHPRDVLCLLVPPKKRMSCRDERISQLFIFIKYRPVGYILFNKIPISYTVM